MMQASDLRHLNYSPAIGRLHWSWDRTVVRERPVRTYPMVICDVIFKNLSELL